MATDLDYSHTAAGILGTHRETMLQNELLLRPQLGKPMHRGYTTFPGPSFTYGRPYKGNDGGTAYAMVGWSNKNREPRAVTTIGCQRDSGDLAALGVTDVTDSLQLRTASQGRGEKRRQKNRRIPPTMVFGISTRPSTPVFDLLEHRYQDKWLEERRNTELQKQQRDQSKKTSGKIYETRASILRTYQNPVEQKLPLWQLPKFTRHAVPALKTFRSEGSRSAAYRNHASDSISRKGVFGHGIYDPAKN